MQSNNNSKCHLTHKDLSIQHLDRENKSLGANHTDKGQGNLLITMHILCPRDEEQLLLPIKSFLFPLSREFKPQINELVGQAGEFINFFLVYSFTYAFASSRRKMLLQEDQTSSPITSMFSAQGVTSARTRHHLPKEKTDRGPNSGLRHASINSRRTNRVHIPTLFPIYLCPTFWMSG